MGKQHHNGRGNYRISGEKHGKTDERGNDRGKRGVPRSILEELSELTDRFSQKPVFSMADMASATLCLQARLRQAEIASSGRVARTRVRSFLAGVLCGLVFSLAALAVTYGLTR